jgi:hypothetical protein
MEKWIEYSKGLDLEKKEKSDEEIGNLACEICDRKARTFSSLQGK